MLMVASISSLTGWCGVCRTLTQLVCLLGYETQTGWNGSHFLHLVPSLPPQRKRLELCGHTEYVLRYTLLVY